MLRPGARKGPGGWRRGQGLCLSLVLRKEAVEMKPGIGFGPLREVGGGRLPARRSRGGVLASRDRTPVSRTRP